jgi:chemotaxis protein histidine kinase CheA
MARRRHREEDTPFGSDSFLDVVANIVGILIILIVIVGLRVRYAPAKEDASADEAHRQAEIARAEEAKAKWETEKSAIESANREARRAFEEEQRQAKEKAERDDELLAKRRREQETLDHERDQHDAELARREAILRDYEVEADRLRREIEDLARRYENAENAKQARQEEVRRRELAIDDEIRLRQKRMESLAPEKSTRESAVRTVSLGSEKLHERITKLRAMIEEEESKPVATKKLRHFATPVARRVVDRELHFRCLNGRIVYTSLDELLLAARDQARGRITFSTSRLDSVAGPIGAFRLKYVLARPPVPLTDQLSELQGVRFTLVYWELIADSPMLGETERECLEPNSAFRVKLRSTPATSATITLWVYADSFDVAKAAEHFLQEQAYTVALRPLPNGVNIIASPIGSASHSH